LLNAKKKKKTHFATGEKESEKKAVKKEKSKYKNSIIKQKKHY